ncbi:Aste57867_13908 [Aphanomyces stellatus]|uniref:Aste57867_13908 protein n=1 Tax=Aphanomyces stellatus TaxID=120398 RepID=A0A485KZM7_9STRA|nr:hypothetical protein As57867_013857 [Aphanomyces stellatus]VFT90739.1 Aste57867_13908 [Aphanomyces stellatus]
MGAGASSPPAFASLPPPQQAELMTKFNALVASGVAEADATTRVAADFYAAAPSTVEIELPRLLDAIAATVDRGKTPLVVDPSGKVDTFFSYRGVTVLDGKKMAMDKSMRKMAMVDILDEARTRVVGALKAGAVPIIVAMGGCVVDFASTFNDAALSSAETKDGTLRFFPHDKIFAHAGRGLTDDDVLDQLYRPADRTAGVVLCRNKGDAYVVLTTTFKHKDFETYLFGKESFGLPKPASMYEFILVKQDETNTDDADE